MTDSTSVSAALATLSAAGWTVPVPNKYQFTGANLVIDPVTGGVIGLIGPDGRLIGSGNYPRNRISQIGSTLIRSDIAAGWTFSGAGSVFSASADFSRRRSTTRLVDMTSASADAVMTYSDATGVAASPTDQLLSFDVYIPNIIQPNVTGSSVSISMFVGNGTSYAAPGTAWVVNSNYLRQGWNTITLCGKDADGVLGADRGTGTLPYGMSKAGASAGASPLNWSNPIKFIEIRFTYNSVTKRKFYVDEIRIPAKIKPFLCIGFDASGSSLSDNIFTTRTAPFLKARNVPSYFTNCWLFDGLYQGTADDTRRAELYSTYGWDAINHSWSHGASVPGALFASGNTLTVSGTGTLATLALSSAHGWTVGSPVLVSVTGATGASSAGANGVFLATAGAGAAVTYAITGGADGVATGTVKVSTYLNDVFNASAVTNQPIVLAATAAQAALNHEFVDLTNNYSRPKGWMRGSALAAYPNNSIPDMTYMRPAAVSAGIKLARGLYGTTCRISEMGVDNPLAIGSFEFNSGSTGSTYADFVNALTGAINRGEGLFAFGHYLRDETLDAVVDIDSPPGKNSNPAAPGASPGLWWYCAQFEKAVNYAQGLGSGVVDLVSASDLVTFIGD